MTVTRLPYSYRSRGRTPFNTGLFLVGLALLALAVWIDARPQIVYAPLVAFAGMTGWLVLRDPRAGLDIDASTLSFWYLRTREQFPTAEIERVHVEHWSDSTDVAVHTRDGRKIDIPDRCRPSLGRLTRALEKAGVTVTSS